MASFTTIKMTRVLYNGCVDERFREVRRILDRYIIEIVEASDLCPWARPARLAGELAVDVVAGAPTVDAWVSAAEAAFGLGQARPSASPTARTRVAMIVAPELACTPAELRHARDAVAARMGTFGVADFHPDAVYDDATPARLVPFLRRSPYPLLQLVPLAILDEVRGAPPVAPRSAQAQMLGGVAPTPRGDIADRIAADNHARVRARRAELEARLADIFADRDASTSR
jgi:hypothetical protein